MSPRASQVAGLYFFTNWGAYSMGISYYDIGYKTGEMAAQILTGEADIASMPIEYAPQFVKKYNPVTCEALGITPPDGYEAIAAG